MKLLKFTLILLISISITSCSENSSESSFALSNENLAGNYNISSFSLNAKITTIVSGFPISVNSNSTGDTFQVDFIIDADGTYTASGQYRILTTLTTSGSQPVTETEIINFTDSGSYQINDTDNTITFIALGDDFIEGKLNVIAFNEDTISLNQEFEEVEGPMVTELNANISFTRQ